MKELIEWAEKRSTWIFILVGILYFAGTGAIAWTKTMWLDEIATHIPATAQSWGELWEYYANGNEVHTPVASAIMRLSLQVFGDNGWGVRLPYIVGYFLLVLGCYKFSGRRAGELWGLVAGSLVLVTSTFEYATEARPYAFLMGLGAMAAWAWQRLGEPGKRAGWLVLMTGSLALSISLHFFGVFLLIPLMGAELARWYERGRKDWAIAIAIALSPLSYLPFLPGVLKGKAIYAGNYWSRPQLSSIEESYRFLLTFAFFPLLAGLLAWALSRFLLPDSKQENESPGKVPMPEWVLVGLWATMPVFMVVASFALGAYVARYALPATFGVVVLITWLFWQRSRNDRWLALVMASVFVFWFSWKTPGTARRQWAESGGYPNRSADAFMHKKWRASAHRSELPVVVTPAVFFINVFQYTTGPLHSRVRYISSRPYATALDGTDTGDGWLIHTTKAGQLPVTDFDEFIKKNPRFLLLANTTVPTWQVEKLRQLGARLELVQREDAQMLFEVSAPGSAPRQEGANPVVPDGSHK